MGARFLNMIRDMPDSADKEQIKRVLNCRDYYAARDDKYGNRRYAIPFSYFMKEDFTNEDFARGPLKDIFRFYGPKERYTTKAANHYDLLAKVIVVLRRD